jgi:hypothetical protein
MTPAEWTALRESARKADVPFVHFGLDALAARLRFVRPGCGGAEVELGYIIPWRLGGACAIWNMVKACPSCTVDKGATLPHEFAAARALEGRRVPLGTIWLIQHALTEQRQLSARVKCRWQELEALSTGVLHMLAVAGQLELEVSYPARIGSSLPGPLPDRPLSKRFAS